MRVAVVHSFLRGISGENSVVENQVDSLRKLGHQVSLIDVRTDSLAKSWSYELRAGIRTASGHGANPLSKIMEISPDVVHLHNLFPNWGTNWLARLRAPLVFQVHNFRTFCAKGTLFRDGMPCELCPTRGSHHAVLNRCYSDSAVRSLPLAIRTRQPDRDPVLSRANRIIFGSEVAIRKLKPFLAREILDRADVLLNYVEPSQMQERVPLGDRTHWVYAGRLVSEKGVEELVTHWPRGKRLKILGDGPLKERLISLSEGKEIEFLGSVTSKQVRDEFSDARGLIFPSLVGENQPMVYSEALAEGLPTIALEGNSVAEDVQSHSTGVVITHLSQLPKALLDVDANWIPLSKTVSRHFENHYSARVWGAKVEAIYGKAITAFQSKNLGL